MSKRSKILSGEKAILLYSLPKKSNLFSQIGDTYSLGMSSGYSCDSYHMLGTPYRLIILYFIATINSNRSVRTAEYIIKKDDELIELSDIITELPNSLQDFFIKNINIFS